MGCTSGRPANAPPLNRRVGWADYVWAFDASNMKAGMFDISFQKKG